jgi:hypothetical protein
MKKSILILLFAGISALIISCGKSDDDSKKNYLTFD